MNEHARRRSAKDGWIYGIFLLFLGYLGIHRFYLHKIGIGIAYLFTGGFLGIGILIDIIVLLAGGVRDADGAEVTIEKSLKVFVSMCLLLGIIGIIIVTALISGLVGPIASGPQRWERSGQWGNRGRRNVRCPKQISIVINEGEKRVSIDTNVAGCNPNVPLDMPADVPAVE